MNMIKISTLRRRFCGNYVLSLPPQTGTLKAQLKKFIFYLVVFVLPSLWVSGCAAPPGEIHPAASDSGPTATLPAKTAPPFPTLQPSATLQPPSATNTPFDTPQPIATLPANPTPTAMFAGDSLWLRITSPLDNSVVNNSPVWVRGEAAAWTVISINDAVLLVDESEMFAKEVTLEQGLNLLEIVASDIQGNEISITLVVDYEP